MSRFEVFEHRESNVRGYCRAFPEVFSNALGSKLYNAKGDVWIDFLSGAGSLNYGHNPPQMKQRLIEYMQGDGVVNSLDMYTEAKQEFLGLFNDCILKPRDLDYKVQFCGPTGTNSVEAAIKLAKKVTGRKGIVSFSNSYHGMSAGAMSASASFKKRNEDYLSPSWVTFLPFCGFTGLDNEAAFIEAMLKNQGSGVAKPAAFIVELVQGEGGINIASLQWAHAVYALAKELGALFIVDEIQSGCGRTGKFFSFEHYRLIPDIVCLSKSVSGFGIPMSLLLMRSELDQWEPGEHNGTFRGFNYGFVTGAETIRTYWSSPEFEQRLARTAEWLEEKLSELAERYSVAFSGYRALGLFAGLVSRSGAIAKQVQDTCFANGLVIETCGPNGEVLKFLPPLNIEKGDLLSGLAILEQAVVALDVVSLGSV